MLCVGAFSFFVPFVKHVAVTFVFLLSLFCLFSLFSLALADAKMKLTNSHLLGYYRRCLRKLGMR